MKKFFLIYILSLHTFSELTLEITQGTEDHRNDKGTGTVTNSANSGTTH